MAISAVGSTYQAIGTAQKTITGVNPTAIGDCLVLAIIGGTTYAVGAVSHAGVTTWHRLGYYVAGFNNYQDVELWYGVVTATGSHTLTITSATTSIIALYCQQFSVG